MPEASFGGFAPRRPNLLKQASGTTGLDGLSLAPSTGLASVAGDRYGQLTITGVATYNVLTAHVPVTAGLTYTASADMATDQPTATINIRIQFFNAAGTVLGAPTSASITAQSQFPDNPPTLTVTGVAPAGAVAARVMLQFASMTGATYARYRYIKLEQGDTATDYNDDTTTALLLSAKPPTGVRYYVDPVNGSDFNIGLSSTNPTKTVEACINTNLYTGGLIEIFINGPYKLMNTVQFLGNVQLIATDAAWTPAQTPIHDFTFNAFYTNVNATTPYSYTNNAGFHTYGVGSIGFRGFRVKSPIDADWAAAPAPLYPVNAGVNSRALFRAPNRQLFGVSFVYCSVEWPATGLFAYIGVDQGALLLSATSTVFTNAAGKYHPSVAAGTAWNAQRYIVATGSSAPTTF